VGAKKVKSEKRESENEEGFGREDVRHGVVEHPEKRTDLPEH
jgi:hypothetical protein